MKKRFFIIFLLVFLTFMSSCKNKDKIEYKINEDLSSYTITKINYIDDKTVFLPNTYKDLPVTKLGDEVFKKSKIESLIIPSNIQEIGDSCFNGCSSLTVIFLPESLKRIGNFAFAGCVKLAKIEIPKSLEEIGEYAFMYCYSIKSLLLPDSVNTIGKGAFMYMSNLEEITLSKSLTKIEDYLFFGCNQLTEIILFNGIIEIGNNSFSKCSNISKIYLPKSINIIGADIILDSNIERIIFGGTKTEYDKIENESKDEMDDIIIYSEK